MYLTLARFVLSAEWTASIRDATRAVEEGWGSARVIERLVEAPKQVRAPQIGAASTEQLVPVCTAGAKVDNRSVSLQTEV